MPRFHYSAASDKGHLRKNNEDTFLSRPELGLWLVADGMGGHEAGEVASAIVRDTIDRAISAGDDLNHAIQQSHQAVLRASDNGDGAVGMGSTVVALISDQDRYEIAWVGDSRAYRWSPADGEQEPRLEQLTTDHSYVQMLLNSGAIEAHELQDHPDKNIITQCLGSQDLNQVQVDRLVGHWEDGQWLLLCSDGLTDELDDQAIGNILARADSPDAAVAQLLSAALGNGGRDNITVQVVARPAPGGPALRRPWRWRQSYDRLAQWWQAPLAQYPLTPRELAWVIGALMIGAAIVAGGY